MTQVSDGTPRAYDVGSRRAWSAGLVRYANPLPQRLDVVCFARWSLW